MLQQTTSSKAHWRAQIESQMFFIKSSFHIRCRFDDTCCNSRRHHLQNPSSRCSSCHCRNKSRVGQLRRERSERQGRREDENERCKLLQALTLEGVYEIVMKSEFGWKEWQRIIGFVFVSIPSASNLTTTVLSLLLFFFEEAEKVYLASEVKWEEKRLKMFNQEEKFS